MARDVTIGGKTLHTHQWLAFCVPLFLLAGSPAVAQRGGGRGGASGTSRRPVICIYDCPDPKSSTDDKNEAAIARLIAIQASTDQIAAFTRISLLTEGAITQLRALRQLQGAEASAPQLAEQASQLGDQIKSARTANRNFMLSLTATQESGLKEYLHKLGRADADLEHDLKEFDLLDPKPDPKQISPAIAALDKALTAFQSEQVALGGEMSAIVSPDQPSPTIQLSSVTHSIDLGGRTLSISTAGAVALKPAAGAAGAQNGWARDSSSGDPTSSSPSGAGNAAQVAADYALKFVADLSDLQDAITAILRSALNQGARCGQRVEILQATLIPQGTAALLTTQLHFERWICPSGLSTATELATGEGSIEFKLQPSLAAGGKVQLAAEPGRVTGQGMLHDALVSGDLGDEVREQVTASLLNILEQAADVKSTLPPTVEPAASFQRIRFQDAGRDRLDLVMDGELHLNGAQGREFASLIKQRLSAQQATQH